MLFAALLFVILTVGTLIGGSTIIQRNGDLAFLQAVLVRVLSTALVGIVAFSALSTVTIWLLGRDGYASILDGLFVFAGIAMFAAVVYMCIKCSKIASESDNVDDASVFWSYAVTAAHVVPLGIVIGILFSYIPLPEADSSNVAGMGFGVMGLLVYLLAFYAFIAGTIAVSGIFAAKN